MGIAVWVRIVGISDRVSARIDSFNTLPCVSNPPCYTLEVRRRRLSATTHHQLTTAQRALLATNGSHPSSPGKKTAIRLDRVATVKTGDSKTVEALETCRRRVPPDFAPRTLQATTALFNLF
jgi:hypothetical protein